MKRRQWLHWGCAQCVAIAGFGGLAGAAQAQSGASTDLPPRLERPDLSTDEGGLWAIMDREETKLRRSPMRLREGGLEAYLSDIVCRLAGHHCPDARVYALRVPQFNASMAPNGMMQVWSGLLLRVDNEAQLAAVLGHEIGHYVKRHSLERMRDIRQRAGVATFASLFGPLGLMAALATLEGAASFSRDHERDADLTGLHLLSRQGYAPEEAARLWSNLLDELMSNPGTDPSKKSVLFATHPPSQERKDNLAKAARLLPAGDTRADALRTVLKPYRLMLIEDEVQRGQVAESAQLFSRLLLQQPGDGELLYGRGEIVRQNAPSADGLASAAQDLEQATHAANAPAVAWRSLGYARRAQNQPKAARAAWQSYLERHPGAPDGALILQNLQELPPA